MRIAQLAGWYSPVSGGIRTVVHRWGEGYRAAGHHTVLCVPGARDAVGPDRVELRGRRIPGAGGYRLVRRPAALRQVLDRFAPDVVELHDKAWLPTVRGWADTRGVPVVLVSHERLDRTLPLLVPALPARIAEVTAAQVRDMVARKADAVVVCSVFARVEYPHARVVPLGVDLATFTPRSLHSDAFRGDPSRPHLVLASRLAREKRPDIAIDTVIALRARGVDARLTVVGDGPLLPDLRRRAAGHPVEFPGFSADRAELAAVLGRADVVLAPGPAETFGLSALEALATGTPVVAARGAAVAELLLSATGPAGLPADLDGGSFATAVQTLLRVPPARRRSSARSLAGAYPWARSVDAMLAVHAAQVGRGRVEPMRPSLAG